MKLLVHQKDFQRAKQLRSFWKERGQEVSIVKNDIEFLQEFYEKEIEIIILDTWIKGMDAFALASRLRKEKANVGILFLTEERGHFYKKKAFESGADYYLSQEISEEELDWHVQALSRRIVGEQRRREHILTWEEIELDLLTRKAKQSGVDMELSETEFHLLVYFVQNIGLALQREAIIEAVWGKNCLQKSNLLDTYVKKLRKKLGDVEHTKISTIRAYGYGIKKKGE